MAGQSTKADLAGTGRVGTARLNDVTRASPPGPTGGVPALGHLAGPDLGLADAYTTAALAMGSAGLDWLASLTGYESAAVCPDGRAYRSGGLPTVNLDQAAVG